MKMKLLAMVFVLIVLVPAAGLEAGEPAAESGTIVGRVTDLDDNPLPGASISLMGTTLMGMRSHVTSATGQFFFPVLTPGAYEIRVEMPGFKIQVQRGLTVQSGRSTQIHVRLEETAVDEEVTVPAGDQPIDTRNAKDVRVVNTETLTRIPLARDLAHLWTLLPGAVADIARDQRFVSVEGSNPRNRIVKLDGAVINDPVTGLPLGHPIEDVIDEVEYTISGTPATVGSSDGAYLQIVTKGGGNAFSGGLSYYSTGDTLAQDIGSVTNTILRTQPADRYESYHDLSLNLGGALLEDRAWIYLAGRRLTTSIANPYSPETRMAALGLTDTAFSLDQREWTGFAKVSVQATSEIKYSGIFQYNNFVEPFDIASVSASASSNRIAERSPENVLATTHNISILINQNTFADLHASLVSRKFTLTSRGETGAAGVYDAAQKIWWGAPEYEGTNKSQNLGASAMITHYKEDFFGVDHEIKFGAEYNQGDSNRDWYRANPFNTYWYDYAAKNPFYYDGLSLGRLEILPAPSASGDWEIIETVRKFSAFFQDTLTRKRLAVNLGVRFDYQGLTYPAQYRTLDYTVYKPAFLNPDITGSAFVSAIDTLVTGLGITSPLNSISTSYRKAVSFATVSPNAGLVFDLLGNGRAALKLSFNRAFEPLWISGFDQGQIFEPQTLSFIWHDLNGNSLMDLPGTDEYTLAAYRSQKENEEYYTDIKAPRADTFAAGLEYEAASNLELGLHFTYRKTTHLIEDVDSINGNDPLATDDIGRIWLPMTVTDPGYDGEFGTTDDGSLTVYGLRADRPAPVLVASNPEGAYRKYVGATFTLDKRMANNWQLQSSLTVSSLRGNLDYSYSEKLNRTVSYNDPNALINTEGPLSYDRPLQAKILAAYVFPLNITCSAFFQYYSGAPWARTVTVYFPAGYMGYGTRQPSVTAYAEPWGTRRSPAIACLDLHLEKSFLLKKGARLSVMVDVFNVTGRNTQTLSTDAAGILDERKTPAIYTVTNASGELVNLYGVRQFRIGVKIGL